MGARRLRIRSFNKRNDNVGPQYGVRFTMDGAVLEEYIESDLQASSQNLVERRDCKNTNQVTAISNFMTGIVTHESSLNDTSSHTLETLQLFLSVFIAFTSTY
jgi:hypothetical protein